MPKSRRLSAYPDQYFQVFELTEAEGQFAFPAIPKKAAEALRFDLYGFKGALHAEEHPSARGWDRYKLTLVHTEEGYCVTLTDVSKMMDALFERCKLPTRSAEPASEPCEDATDIEPMDDTLASLGFKSEGEGE